MKILVETWISEDLKPRNSREEYERDLKERQRRHLEKIEDQGKYWQPCLHDQCSDCVGTGRKRDGSLCVHCLSCPCSKCSPYRC